MENNQRRFPARPRTRQPQEEGCKLVFKKRKDGTVIKEIKGKCSKEQLDALSRNDLSDIGGSDGTA